MSDEKHDRGVDVEKLMPEIEALRTTTIRYAAAAVEGLDTAGGAGIDLETAAIRYVRKLDEESRKANAVDYLAIVEQAARNRDSEN
jgi:Cu/Ag efflux protein CusF